MIRFVAGAHPISFLSGIRDNGCPTLCAAKGGIKYPPMPQGLRRFHNTGQRHFITCSCYRRQPFLGSARRRDYFLKIFEEVRQKYDFVVWGYVIMPEHFHFLISEPAKVDVARVMQVLKQRVSRGCRKKKKPANQMKLWESHPVRAFWQRRSHDFNVFTERKHLEKLRYMHRNPVKRGLVSSPELWRWSSFRFYRLAEEGPVKIGTPSATRQSPDDTDFQIALADDGLLKKLATTGSLGSRDAAE